MKFRIGIDIIEIERIRDTIARRGAAFLNRIFTPAEQEYCEQHVVDPAMRYAGRYAAKEAISKALGSGITVHVSWLDMEIHCRETGEPWATLSDEASKQFAFPAISLSISHCRELAVAVAVLVSAGEGNTS